MRTLLTGATGYIGRHLLADLLDDGHHVTALVREPDKLDGVRDPALRIVQAELGGLERIAHVLVDHDVLVHAALVWGEPGSEHDAPDTAASARLFEAVGSAGVRRCIYLSSTAVHRPFSAEMREEDRLLPADIYGATKAASELFLRAASSTHSMTGVVVRPGPVVGPPASATARFRAHGRLMRIVQKAMANEPIQVRAGEGRQWCDVRVLSRVIVELTGAQDPPDTLLCVDRHSIPWETVARRIVAALGSSSRIEVEPGEARAPAFITERLEAMLRGPMDSTEALGASISAMASQIVP